MDDSEIKVTKKDNQRVSFRRLLDVLSYPIAAISGYAVAHNSVREDVYDTAKRFGAFDDILDHYRPINHANVKAVIAKEISQEEFLARSAVTKAEYSLAANRRLEEMGIGGLPQMWNYIRRGNKQKALIEGMTVTGIAIGALLSIVHSKALASLFSEEKESGR